MDTKQHINEAMDEISGLNKAGKAGTQDIKGKTYTKVAARVEVFRKHLGLEYGLDSQISSFEGGVLCKVFVTKGEDVIGSGHAYTTGITKEKGLEKLESTAVGRAMASLGLAGGEYASDAEMESWGERYAEPKPITVLDKTGNRLIDNAVKEAIGKINDLKTKDSVTKNGRELYRNLQSLGATEEQLGMVEDQVGSKIKQLEKP